MTMTTRPTSLSDSGVQLSPDAETTLPSLTSPLSDSNSSMMSDDGKRGDDTQRAKSRMEKYFAEKTDKNIFMKIIHPSYHERNQQFKKNFVDKGLIDENDQFLASYSCAYQREILAQGRMFISQFHVCFHANIMGWETTLVIPMKEIKLVKKMKAAYIFPNSIQIERNTSEKYFFASFINRDKSFQVLTTAHQKMVGEEARAMTREEVWDMVYNNEDKAFAEEIPYLPERLDEMRDRVRNLRVTNRLTVAIPAENLDGSFPTPMSINTDNIWDCLNPQNQTPPDGSTPASSIKTASTENMSTLATSPTFTVSSTSDSTTMKPSDKDNTSQSSTSSDFHDDDSTAHLSEQFDMDDEEVQCPCSEHTGRLIMDQEVKVSVEKLYELLFTENDFMSEYNKKNRVDSFVAATWVRNHQGENTRSCTYTIFVANPLASKDIVVNEKQVLIHFTNPKHGFIMQKETQNSGVPYADHFTVNCQYCVSRTGPTSCRVKVHAAIVYKKSIWGVVKGFVEKGTFSALDEHYKILSKMFEEYTLKNPEPEKRSIVSANFPDLDVTLKPSDKTPEIRRRRTKMPAGDRLIAGGEVSKSLEFAPMPREIQPITVTSSAEYKPFLYIITALLALFLILNLYVLRGFQKESTAVAINNNQDLGQMLSILMDQVKELKEKVDQMKANQ